MSLTVFDLFAQRDVVFVLEGFHFVIQGLPELRWAPLLAFFQSFLPTSVFQGNFLRFSIPKSLPHLGGAVVMAKAGAI